MYVLKKVFSQILRTAVNTMNVGWTQTRNLSLKNMNAQIITFSIRVRQTTITVDSRGIYIASQLTAEKATIIF